MKKSTWLDPVPFRMVEIRDAFWTPRQEINRRVTLPSIYRQMKKTGRIDIFDLTWKPGDRHDPHIFWDSDVAKWVEAASYAQTTHPGGKAARILDDVVEKIVKAQQPDGYLNTYFTVKDPRGRWSNLRDLHELYCAGHLMEAAVALHEATGKRNLLDAACRFADCIDALFGKGRGKKKGYPGHQEIELALIRLYRATGEKRYLDLAGFFLNQRGKRPHYYDKEARARGEDPRAWRFETYAYCQAHKPVREQKDAQGHAVRALYMYCGMADLARETGDASLMKALRTLWESACLKRMYVIGGVGSSSGNEGFTEDYDLPEEGAYAETCASVALVLFNHRMLQYTRDARYADVMERALYNGVISGVSLDGEAFYYSNPMVRSHPGEGRGNGAESIWDGVTYTRKTWFGCACCPSNLARLLASLGGYFYSLSRRGVWVHLYARSTARLCLPGNEVILKQSTEYPWKGRIRLEVTPEREGTFDLNLRIPGWCPEARISAGGRRIAVKEILNKGYARLRRTWRPGDVVTLDLSMPVERITAHPRVRDAAGKVALQRGPLVYCLEETDNPFTLLERFSLPRNNPIKVRFEKNLLEGVAVLEGRGILFEEKDWGKNLYRHTSPRMGAVAFRAVPYCVWDNRGLGAMRIWIRSH